MTTAARSRIEDEQIALYSDPDTCPTDALKPAPLEEEPAFVAWQQDIPGTTSTYRRKNWSAASAWPARSSATA